MQDRVAKNPKVDYAWNSVVAEVLGEKQDGHQVLTGVKLRSTKDNSTRDLKIDGLFLAIGHVPNTAIFQGQLAMTPDGYLLTRTALAWKGVEAPPGLLDTLPNYGTATNVEGVFACGDVVDTHYRQAITAAGSGLRGRHGLRKMAGIDPRRLVPRTEPSRRSAFRLERPRWLAYHALRQPVGRVAE